MQGIEFETDKNSNAEIIYSSVPKEGFLIKLIKRSGISDSNTANFILLGIVALFSGIAIFIYAGTLGGQKKDLAAEARALLIMNNAR